MNKLTLETLERWLWDSADLLRVLHYLFTTELKVMRFIIVVENTVKIVKQYFNQEK